MKVIDLLNKIANGEEVPKNIKHQYYDYKWNEIDKDYQKRSGEMLLGNMNIQYHLNDEVVLIEEQEEIDIQNIKEHIIPEIAPNTEMDMWHDRIKVNELIQAIKQIDKKIKEI